MAVRGGDKEKNSSEINSFPQWIKKTNFNEVLFTFEGRLGFSSGHDV